MPFGSTTRTGLLPTAFTCVRFQDIRASLVSTTIGPFQVPVRLRPPAWGAVGLLSALQPITNPSRTTATVAVFLMGPRGCEICTSGPAPSKSCAIVSARRRCDEESIKADDARPRRGRSVGRAGCRTDPSRGAEGRRSGSRFYAAGYRRQDLHPQQGSEGALGRAGVVPEGLHRWLNRRMQLAP